MYKNGSKFMLFLMLFAIATAFFIMPTLFYAMGMTEEEVSYLIRTPLFLIVSQLVMLLMPLLLWVYANRGSFTNFLKFEPLEPINVLIIMGIAFLIQPALMFVSGLTGLFFPNVIGDVVAEFMAYPFWLVLLAIAVTPAIVEELVFRGYIQAQYEELGIKKAAIISGLFFGIIHLNMQQFFYAFIAGIIFAYIVYYTKNIVSGILAHFMLNASQLLMLRTALILEEMEIVQAYEAVPMPEITPLQVVVAIGIFALFTTPPAVFLLWMLIKRCKKAHVAVEPAACETELQSPADHKRPFIDPFLIAVVVLYVAFIIFTRFDFG